MTRSVFAQNPNIDVQSYHFTLKLTDANDTIRGRADIGFKNLKNANTLVFDLVARQDSGRGMKVDSIFSDGKRLQYFQKKDSLSIIGTRTFEKVSIYYHGMPDDGLIIGENKFGNRTFFGDNWPNRAHHWLPCIDHPSDKAFVKFTVDAPSHYQVISNGELLKKNTTQKKRVTYTYKSKVPLPTKVMVIGVAKFAVKDEGKIDGVPLSSWVYPENKKEGFYDYAPAKSILSYFTEKIGPFPFAKLANVQSTTRYGGMENAGAIFYAENSVTGKGSIQTETLLAHEIAHQWFGDSATETDWPQIWLSEGFATYFADLYLKNEYGEKTFKERLQEQRQEVLNFNRRVNTPVIDTTRTDLKLLLNPNSYQKGAWVLHLLHRKLGDKLFWKGIRAYYETYKFKNANSKDLQHIFEKTSNQDLSIFFDQWLRNPEHPILNCQLLNKQKIMVEQTQKRVFDFSLELKLNFTDGSSETKSFDIGHRKQVIGIFMGKKKTLKNVEIDPNINLLFEMENNRPKVIY